MNDLAAQIAAAMKKVKVSDYNKDSFEDSDSEASNYSDYSY
jgi:hypothetical protein